MIGNVKLLSKDLQPNFWKYMFVTNIWDCILKIMLIWFLICQLRTVFLNVYFNAIIQTLYRCSITNKTQNSTSQQTYKINRKCQYVVTFFLRPFKCNHTANRRYHQQMNMFLQRIHSNRKRIWNRIHANYNTNSHYSPHKSKL